MYYRLLWMYLGFAILPNKLFSQTKSDLAFRKAISSYLIIPDQKINTVKSGIVLVEFYSIHKKDTARVLQYTDNDYLAIVDNAIKQYFKNPVKGMHFLTKRMQPFVFLISSDEGHAEEENMVKIDKRDICFLTNLIPYQSSDLNKPIIQTAIKSKIKD